MILGHNNETQLAIILRIDSARRNQNLKRFVQILLVNELDLDVYITKQEMEEAEKKKGIKKGIKLEYDRMTS